MAEDHSEDIQALRSAITELRIASATLTAAVEMLSQNYALMSETFARKDVYEPRVASLEKTREWAGYLIVGAVILAVLGLILTGGGGKL